MLRPAPLALFSATGGGSKRCWKTARVCQPCPGGSGGWDHPCSTSSGRPCARGSRAGSSPGCCSEVSSLALGYEPQHPPCSCLWLSEYDHHFKGSGAASPPRGASRLRGDRAREVEARDKAWEGRRKDQDQSQPAELQGLKIAAAPAWHCSAERSLLLHPCASILGVFQFSLQEGLRASGKAPL